MAYDSLGNITSKTGVGSYSYSSRPHAVSGITGTVNGVVNPSYTYDANGTMTGGDGRTITPTSFNMAASIVQGSNTVSFTYDSEHARVAMTGPSGTTTYANDPVTGTMEEKLGTTWHDYIVADGQIVAEKFSGGTTAVRYFVTDHLGSTAVVTNEAGTVVERNAYDPWGKRRNTDGSDDTACSLTSQTTRGFTGHEHIDSECLINMNARIYDPTIARFISADDIVQDGNNGQAYNRYSYVLGRVLAMVDPTGHIGGVNYPQADLALISLLAFYEVEQVPGDGYCNGQCPWNHSEGSVIISGNPPVVGSDPIQMDNGSGQGAGQNPWKQQGTNGGNVGSWTDSKAFKCAMKAAKAKGLNVALDIAGCALAANPWTSLGVSTASMLLSAAQGNYAKTGAATGMYYAKAFAPTLSGMGYTALARYVPWVGVATNFVSGVRDISAMNDIFNDCMNE